MDKNTNSVPDFIMTNDTSDYIVEPNYNIEAFRLIKNQHH